jgi:hypothetical protein
MANTILLKRSAVPGRVPTTSDIPLGSLALNTYDGKLYTKKDDGSPSIVELSGGAGGGAGGAGQILEPAYLISADLTLATGFNGLSVGPVEVAATYAVTVPANATWMVL